MMKVLVSYPACDIVERECDEDGVMDVAPGDLFSLEPRYMVNYKAGSIRSYCAEVGYDPDERFNQAKEKGHALYWLNQMTSSLTVLRRERLTYISIKTGQVIRMEGQLLLVKAAANNNLKLVLLED